MLASAEYSMKSFQEQNATVTNVMYSYESPLKSAEYCEIIPRFNTDGTPNKDHPDNVPESLKRLNMNTVTFDPQVVCQKRIQELEDINSDLTAQNETLTSKVQVVEDELEKGKTRYNLKYAALEFAKATATDLNIRIAKLETDKEYLCDIVKSYDPAFVFGKESEDPVIQFIPSSPSVSDGDEQLTSPRGTKLRIERDPVFGKPIRPQDLDRVKSVYSKRGKKKGVYYSWFHIVQAGYHRSAPWGNVVKLDIADLPDAEQFAESAANPESDAGFFERWIRKQGLWVKLLFLSVLATLWCGTVIFCTHWVHRQLECGNAFNSINPFCVGTTAVLAFVTKHAAELVTLIFAEIIYGLTLMFLYFASFLDNSGKKY
ncbi:hypothetical protein CYMTET_42562 [Cymbomonas tetramitiformis]|nr:hypothetical protein CYMTET_42562 [Cymbomonas tetramitiformis]